MRTEKVTTGCDRCLVHIKMNEDLRRCISIMKKKIEAFENLPKTVDPTSTLLPTTVDHNFEPIQRTNVRWISFEQKTMEDLVEQRDKILGKRKLHELGIQGANIQITKLTKERDKRRRENRKSYHVKELQKVNDQLVPLETKLKEAQGAYLLNEEVCASSSCQSSFTNNNNLMEDDESGRDFECDSSGTTKTLQFSHKIVTRSQTKSQSLSTAQETDDEEDHHNRIKQEPDILSNLNWNKVKLNMNHHHRNIIIQQPDILTNPNLNKVKLDLDYNPFIKVEDLDYNPSIKVEDLDYNPSIKVEDESGIDNT